VGSSKHGNEPLGFLTSQVTISFSRRTLTHLVNIVLAGHNMNIEMDTVLSKFHTFPILSTYFPKIHLNVIFSPSSQSSKWLFSKRFSHQHF